MISLQTRDGGFYKEQINKMRIKITWINYIRNKNKLRNYKENEIFKA